MWVEPFRPSVDIVIDGIEMDSEIFIVVVVWLLEVDASGSRYMISSVQPCWGELWSFPHKVLAIAYLVESCSLVLNDQIFYSN